MPASVRSPDSPALRRRFVRYADGETRPTRRGGANWPAVSNPYDGVNGLSSRARCFRAGPCSGPSARAGSPGPGRSSGQALSRRSDLKRCFDGQATGG